jgi:dTDP-glucose 4,6-dehydratase
MAKPIPDEDLELILEATRGLWQQMRGERLFLTGGTGFFGCWLLESFLHANRTEKLSAQVTVLTRNPEAFLQKCPHVANEPSIDLLQGDVCSFAYPEGEYKFVIHAATETVSNQTPTGNLDLLSSIVDGTERVLQFAAGHGCRKLLFTSSGAVYGKQPSEITHLSESYSGAPDALLEASAYGEGKRMAENLCTLYAAQSQMECKIARCFAFVGPHLPLDAHFAVGNFIRDILRKQPIHISGDGTPMRSYMYSADLAIWLWVLLFSGQSLRAYNVGSDRAVTILQLAQEAVTALGVSNPIEVANRAVPGSPILRYVPDTARASEELGLQVRVDLRDAIRRTAQWVSAQ